MQPDYKPKIIDEKFHILKNALKINVEGARIRRSSTDDGPDVVGIKLTNRCNLRCTHCYQWNDAGFHRDMSRQEQQADMPVDMFKSVLDDTRSRKARLYLWGGEPFVHKKIDQLLQLLRDDVRDTTICTNSYYIHRHERAICEISSSLDLLIALEGFAVEHDSIRGKGSFDRVVANIKHLVSLRQAGIYSGKISVHAVINDGMVGKIYEFIAFLEGLGVDLVLLCFPWFISAETSQAMDAFVEENLSSICDNRLAKKSWHGFDYKLDESKVSLLIQELEKISAYRWTCNVRFQPGLDKDEILSFVRGDALTPRCAQKCRVLDSRVEVGPTGDIGACKFFPELKVGSLHNSTLSDVWKSDSYEKLRAVFAKGLSPACSKCSALYLSEHSMPITLL